MTAPVEIAALFTGGGDSRRLALGSTILSDNIAASPEVSTTRRLAGLLGDALLRCRWT